MAERCRFDCGLVGCVLLLFIAAHAVAQSFEVQGVKYDLSKTMGTIGSIGPGGITIKSNVRPMQIVVSDAKLAELKKSTVKAGDPPITTEVSITGNADPSYLTKDQCVSFSADLKNGKGTAPVTELTLFTAKSPQDLSIASGDGSETGAAINGTYLIAGQVVSFGRGQLVVTAPTDKGRKIKVTVQVPDDAKISVNIADLSVVQPGDTVAVDGYIGTPKGGQAQNTMLAETLKVTMAKPLMSKSKRRELGVARRDAGNPPAKEKNAEVAAPDRKDIEKPPAVALSDPTPTEKNEAVEVDPATESSSAKVETAEAKPDKQANDEELIYRDTFGVDEDHAAAK